MNTVISKWGNSQGIRIPKEILKKINLLIGEKVSLKVIDNKIIIEPVKKRKKYNIKDLIEKLPEDFKSCEEFSNQIGKEEW